MTKAVPQLFGVLGHRISYSLSPAIFRLLFKKYSLPHSYALFDVEPGRFWEFMEAVRFLDIRGFNVTIPFKLDLAQHVDRLDSTAARCGSINTVINRRGKLVGYNTDGFGIRMALRSAGLTDMAGRSVLIVGAGGTARTALAWFLTSGVREVSIVNRSKERLAEMIASCRIAGKKRLVTFDPDDIDSRLVSMEFDVIFNATPVATNSVVPRKVLRSCKFLLQAAYNVRTGRLPAGIHLASGLDMLIFQALRSFELFTGIDVGDYSRTASFVKRKIGRE